MIMFFYFIKSIRMFFLKELLSDSDIRPLVGFFC